MLKIELPHNPAIPLIKYIPKRNEIYAHTEICMLMFIVGRKWEPKYPSSDKWMNQMWYSYTMAYYSAIKRNEVVMHAII